MTATSVLAEVTRGQQLESRHFGSVVFANSSGNLLGVIGDHQSPVFPRSAIKIIQALPLIESGAADQFQFTPVDLALACGSHGGTPQHVATAGAILRRLGLQSNALNCGNHAPLDVVAHHDLLRSGQLFSPLHNNCSGKHIGMLATALHLDDTIDDYELTHHPVQRRIRDAITETTSTDLSKVMPGIDGCSVPNWPLSLDKLAIVFARIVSGQGFNPSRQSAFERLLSACWDQPQAMAGTGRFDTIMLERFPGDVFVKGGAEGVYCGGVRSKGIGFAVKIDDGAQRASEAAIRAILACFANDADDLAEPTIVKNANNIAVGDIRPGTSLMTILDRIQL